MDHDPICPIQRLHDALIRGDVLTATRTAAMIALAVRDDDDLPPTPALIAPPSPFLGIAA